LEGELGFITFDDLMDHIETIVSLIVLNNRIFTKVFQICETVDRLLQDESSAAIIQQLNPGFKSPSRPFKRMSYVDAIAWLNEHRIQHEAEDADGNPIKDEQGNIKMVDHALGDDIAEAAERQMTDIIGVPIFLHSFPAELKAFYMKKIPGQAAGEHIYTESCDLLMPGVGEIVGGSMRIADHDELMAAYKREGMDPTPYFWYVDQRKYGTCEHGGYGLGVEVCGASEDVSLNLPCHFRSDSLRGLPIGTLSGKLCPHNMLS
jgi:asparaginyl-tRNA synthetase